MMSFETGNICSFKKTKISIKEIIKVFQWVNISYSEKDPDIAIVIGRDGTFGLSLKILRRDGTFGLSLKILRIPMLFVGINDPDK